MRSMALLSTAFAAVVFHVPVAAQAASETSVFIDPATPDQNEQFTCPATVIVRYNALRYASAQVVVIHNYSLPTDVNPFGDLGQATGTAQKGGGVPAVSGATALQTAIQKTEDAENAVAALRGFIAQDATAIQQLVVRADKSTAPLSDIVATSHSVAARIASQGTNLQWPSTPINEAVKYVRLAAAASGSDASSKSVAADLQKEITALQQAPDDPTNSINVTLRALQAWQPILQDVQVGDFTLAPVAIRCPTGPSADNATVSFVAIDRTLVTSLNGTSSANNATTATVVSSASTPTGSTSTAAAGSRPGTIPSTSSPSAATTPASSRGNAKPASAQSNGSQGSSPQSNATAAAMFKRDIFVSVGPSRLTSTHGIGFSNIPNTTWKAGTTVVAGAASTQVQPDRQDNGRPFLMTEMVHYRLTPIAEPLALHATFAMTASQQQLVSGFAGLSLSLHQSLYLSAGIFRADTLLLNGYSPYEIVPKGTTVSTFTHAVNRIGYALSIPIFPSESGKSKATPSTANPTTQAKPGAQPDSATPGQGTAPKH